MSQSLYKAQEFKLSGLKGISDRTLEMHLSLYEGYVKNTNALTEKLAEMTHKKKASAKDPAFAELTRRPDLNMAVWFFTNIILIT